MIKAGLTGSIGMGKSTTAEMFRAEGIAVYDADATVHGLYNGEAASRIEDAFPGTVIKGRVDREKLSSRVLGKPDQLKKLESIVHPLVHHKERAFVKEAKEGGAFLVVLDVPLLFETGGAKRVDKIIVVTTPAHIQRQRVLSRPGMSKEKFEAILSRQVPDLEKRARADFIIDTAKGLEAARNAVRRIIETLHP